MAYGVPRIGLAGRLMAATIALVVITSATIAVLNHRSASEAILQQGIDRLQIAGSWRGHDLEAAAGLARGDLIALARQIEIRHAGEDIAGPLNGTLRGELTALMTSTLDAKPDVSRLRLMRLDGGSVTMLLSVEREADGRTRISPGAAGRPMPLAAVIAGVADIPAGAVRLGEIVVEPGPGDRTRPVLPMIRRVRPGGDTELALALDYDLSAMLVLLNQRAPIGGTMSVIDERGRFLLDGGVIAPEGRTAAEAHPELARLLAARGGTLRLPEADGREGRGVALVQQRLLDGPMVGLLTQLPDSVILKPIAGMQKTTLLGALAAGIVSIVLTVGLIRSLTRPLRRMTDAIRAMSRGESAALPVDEGGEVGILARAHNELIATIRQKTVALEQEAEQRQKTLNLLSRHVEKASLFTALNKSSEDAIITLTPDGVISSWNPAAERLLGPREAAMVGQPIANILPKPIADKVMDTLRRPDESSGIDNLETNFERTDGRVAEISVNLWPIRSDTGIVIGGALLARDIRARKRAEENFRLAVMASPNGMVMVDRKGAIVMVNTAAETMFGYGHGELTGQTVDMLVPAELRHGHEHHREVYTFRPETRRMGAGRELHGQRKDGSRFPVEIGLNAIHSVEGMLTLAVVVDISERRAHELAMQEHTAELKRSNADLEQFAYVASHDLREPLRMVANYTELLAERYKGRLDERADTYIGYAVEGAKRMQQLVSDLLAYARVGTQARPSTPVESGEVVRRVLAGMQGAVMESAAAITVQPDLPVVLCDEIQLGQVFQNLIGNAIKFSPKDRKAEISISAEQDGQRWVFRVRDNGIGIEERFAERIFQMFQRLHDRGQYEGSGIGLAISKRIVERHGGKLWFKSVPGEGSEFFFQMPASKEGVVA